MQRPIGVVLLAAGAGIAALYQLYLMLVYMGILSFDFIGNNFQGGTFQFQEAQWGAALWSLLIAAIWAWVALGFWNVRLYAARFGQFIALFTLIWGFFALLFGSTYEAQTIPWLLAGAIYLYLSYPGVLQHFIDNEMSRLTPEQREAMEALEKANMEADAKAAPGMGKPASAAAPTSSDPGSSGDSSSS